MPGKIGTVGCSELTREEQERYARQIALPDFGAEAQRRLKSARVLVIGAGGLGSPVLQYLAAAGVGTIGIADNDRVSASNLQRQVLYDTFQVGKSKAECARERLQRLNPDIEIRAFDTRFTSENAAALLSDFDLVVDCTDNLATRYLIDRASRAAQKPFVYASVCEFRGQVSVFNYLGAPSYEDLYPYSPEAETFAQPQGVLGAFVGIVASIQAMETVKVIIGSENTLAGFLLLVDMEEYAMRKVKVGI